MGQIETGATSLHCCDRGELTNLCTFSQKNFTFPSVLTFVCSLAVLFYAETLCLPYACSHKEAFPLFSPTPAQVGVSFCVIVPILCCKSV